MSKRKITLAGMKEELARDVVFKSAPADLKRSAILYALEEIEKAPEKYTLTKKSKDAIVAYADSLVK